MGALKVVLKVKFLQELDLNHGCIQVYDLANPPFSNLWSNISHNCILCILVFFPLSNNSHNTNRQILDQRQSKSDQNFKIDLLFEFCFLLKELGLMALIYLKPCLNIQLKEFINQM